MRRNLFNETNEILLRRYIEILEDWLPGGKLQGHEYVSLNPLRTDNNFGSFKINIHTGKWCDFAIGIGGGDPVSLYAYLQNKRQNEAARELLKRYGGV